MKICSIKSISKWLAMAAVASSTTLFADLSSHSHSSHDNRFDRCIENLDVPGLIGRLEEATHAHFAALDSIYSYEGAISNPDPATNAALRGIIASNNAVIAEVRIQTTAVLQSLGVSDAVIAVLNNQSIAFDSAAEYYALAVNMTNTGHAGFNQVQAAIALEQAAQNLGTSYMLLTGNPIFVTFWTDIANLTTQVVQAYRLVLNTDNVFGAVPGDEFSETAAATSINVAIHDLVDAFDALLVNELSDELCEEHRRR